MLNSISDLLSQKKMSVRSFHVCERAGIHNIKDLLDFYEINGTFQQIRNCGQQSNFELIKLCQKYINQYYEQYGEDRDQARNQYQNVLDDASPLQREILNKYILLSLDKLSVRSKNIVSRYLDERINLNSFTEKILLNSSFDLRKMQNSGAKSILEITSFINNIKKYILDIYEIANEDNLQVIRNDLLLLRSFGIANIPFDIIASNSIFLITDYLFRVESLFDKKTTAILKQAFRLFSNQPKSTLDEIAVTVKLTRERVRQLVKKNISVIQEKLLFVRSFDDHYLIESEIDKDDNYIFINEGFTSKTNDKYNINLSSGFISLILSAYLKKSHVLVGDIEDVLQWRTFKDSNRHNWKNLYLVHRKINAKCNLISFINDISSRLNQRIKSTYELDLQQYLYDFGLEKESVLIDDVLSLCKLIIQNEFNLSLNENNAIEFTKNTIKLSHEYSYEALESLGTPSKVSEITKRIFEVYPDYETNEDKVRSSMTRDKGFVPIGRSSVYGLKKWEVENEDFKGGTIREIIRDYLLMHSSPKHIDDIVNYVVKYRPSSNRNSIWTNLKLDQSQTFEFFKDSLIGLSSYENATTSDDLITNLIALRSKLNKAPKKQDINYLDNELINEYRKKIQSILNDIVKRCFLDFYTISDIERLSLEDQKSIFSKVGHYFEKQQSINLISLESDTEDESSPIELYRNLCEALYSDGLLTIQEKHELNKEQNKLGISDEVAKNIIESTRLIKEKYKLGDLILEIVKDEKNLNLSMLTETLKDKYKIDIDIDDVKRNILQVLNTRVYLDANNQKVSLHKKTSPKNEELKVIKTIKLGDIKFIGITKKGLIIEPYVDIDMSPIKNLCYIVINENHPSFNKHSINEYLTDGILLYYISLKNSSNITSRTHFELKDRLKRKIIFN